MESESGSVKFRSTGGIESRRFDSFLDLPVLALEGLPGALDRAYSILPPGMGAPSSSASSKCIGLGEDFPIAKRKEKKRLVGLSYSTPVPRKIREARGKEIGLKGGKCGQKLGPVEKRGSASRQFLIRSGRYF